MRWSGVLTLSRRTFLLAADAKRLLDRLGLGDNRAVRRLRRAARGVFFSQEPEPGAGRSVRVRVDGLTLELPERFLPQHVHHEYEPLTTRWLREATRPGMRVADVGAHIGYFSLLLGRLVGERGHVYAVEPADENIRFLERNLTANRAGNVTLLRVAAGKESRRRTFRLSDSSDSHGFYEHPFAAAGTTLEVDEAPLDDLIEGPVDIVKVDVEGAELEVLAGMRRLLQDSPAVRLVIEWNPACLRAAGHDPSRLPLELRERGFELTVLDERTGSARDVEGILSELEQGTLDTHWYANLVCIRSAG